MNKTLATLALAPLALAGFATAASAEEPVEIPVDHRFNGGDDNIANEVTVTVTADAGDYTLVVPTFDTYEGRADTDNTGGQQDQESVSVYVNGELVGSTADLADGVENATAETPFNVTLTGNDTVTFMHDSDTGAGQWDSVEIGSVVLTPIPEVGEPEPTPEPEILIPAPEISAPAPVDEPEPFVFQPVLHTCDPNDPNPEAVYVGDELAAAECPTDKPALPSPGNDNPAELAYTGAATNIMIASGLALLLAGTVMVRKAENATIV